MSLQPTTPEHITTMLTDQARAGLVGSPPDQTKPFAQVSGEHIPAHQPPRPSLAIILEKDQVIEGCDELYLKELQFGMTIHADLDPSSQQVSQQLIHKANEFLDQLQQQPLGEQVSGFAERSWKTESAHTQSGKRIATVKGIVKLVIKAG